MAMNLHLGPSLNELLQHMVNTCITCGRGCFDVHIVCVLFATEPWQTPLGSLLKLQAIKTFHSAKERWAEATSQSHIQHPRSDTMKFGKQGNLWTFRYGMFRARSLQCGLFIFVLHRFRSRCPLTYGVFRSSSFGSQ